jgi:hypothetical protein
MAESSPPEVSQLHSTPLRGVETPVQIAIPVSVSVTEIARKPTLGSAMELCAEIGGYALDKTLQQDLKVDQAQFSRWKSDTEGITWKKLRRYMDLCGNHAPVLWMLYQLGYDLHSLRLRETETERELRKAREEIAELRREREITMKVLREVRT